MIIIDTNIISEMMKPSPDESVIAWFDRQEASWLFITTITIAEISYGLHALPTGSRRSLLEDTFTTAIEHAFKHRILSFDESAAYLYGKIMSVRKKLGRPLGILDGQISAIAHVHGAAVATRNVKDFVDCEIDLINPFG